MAFFKMYILTLQSIDAIIFNCSSRASLPVALTIRVPPARSKLVIRGQIYTIYPYRSVEWLTLLANSSEW